MLVGRRDRTWYLIGAALVVSGLVHLGVAGLSDRPWAGPLSWRKPFTFGLSFGITLQAWRHVPSHFNTSKPFNRTVAMTLAVGGAVLVVVLGRFALEAFRGHVDGPADLRLAVQGGFALLLAGLGAGVAMIAYGTVLIRTGHVAEGYDDGGFLKGFHGATIHAVLVLPGLAWRLARRGTGEAHRLRVVRAALAAYVVVAATVLATEIVSVL